MLYNKRDGLHFRRSIQFRSPLHRTGVNVCACRTNCLFFGLLLFHLFNLPSRLSPHPSGLAVLGWQSNNAMPRARVRESLAMARTPLVCAVNRRLVVSTLSGRTGPGACVCVRSAAIVRLATHQTSFEPIFDSVMRACVRVLVNLPPCSHLSSFIESGIQNANHHLAKTTQVRTTTWQLRLFLEGGGKCSPCRVPCVASRRLRWVFAWYTL